MQQTPRWRVVGPGLVVGSRDGYALLWVVLFAALAVNEVRNQPAPYVGWW